MKINGKKLMAIILALTIAISMAAASLTSTFAIVSNDESYVPEGVAANKYYFAMPGTWENDYWKWYENRAGIYWWTGADVPKDNFAHEWPGYVVPRVKTDPVQVDGDTAVEIKNLYETFVPKDTNMIIFNNHINCGMPSEPDFNWERFDAAKQSVDTNATYNYIGDDDYQDKALWMYVYDRFCEIYDLPMIVWDTTTKEYTGAEKAQIRALLYPASKLKDNEKRLIAESGFEIPEKSVYEMVDDWDLDPDEFLIEEFGDYAPNFYLDTEEQAGIVQNFDNMVYVCNLEPNSIRISTMIVPEGVGTYDGDFFFYYGNGEFGTFPTKEMTINELGITFAADGAPIAPEGYSVDKYGFVVKPAPGLGFEGADTTMMVYGNFTGHYYERKEAPEVPTSAVEPTAIPATQPTWVPPEGAENKVYFQVDSSLWKNYKNITCYIYPHNGGDAPFAWGSKKGVMTYEGGDIWSFDFDEKGIYISPYKQYGIYFTGDWGVQTCLLIFDASIMGDTACLAPNQMENEVDSNKKSYEAKWKNADPTKYGPAKCITSIGNVIGTAYWADTSAYYMLVNFIKSDGMDGLSNALNFNGKTAQQTLDDTANALGLTSDDIERAIAESGKYVDWSESGSTAKYDVITNAGFKFTELDDGTYMLSDYDNRAKTHIKIPSTVHVLKKSRGQVGAADTVSAWEEPTEVPTTEPWTEEPTTEPWTEEPTIIVPTMTVRPTEAATLPPQYIDVPVTAIGSWVFANNKYVETVEIPDSIKTIGTGAFYNCVSLQRADIPDSVTSIGTSIFEKCLSLEEVTLGNNLTSIGDEAFFDCRRLKSLDIPDSVKSIGEEAFTNCRSLTELTVPKGVKKLGSEDSVGLGMFENCKSLKEITIPDSVGYIQPNAFDGCSNVTILGAEDSYAQTFALEQQLPFMAMIDTDCIVGDVSGDGNVDITDATIVQQFAAEVFVPTALQRLAADTNGDGNVDITDATLIQMLAAEIINKF